MAKASLFAVSALAAMIGATVPAQAELVAENLLTGLPKGFKVGFQATQGKMDIMEFVPVAETVNDWSAMVTVQIFHGQSNVDGNAFAKTLARLWDGGCKGGSSRSLESGEVNKYPQVLWQYRCPLNAQTGKPETMWLKAVSGADALYVVQYAYRAEADAQMEEAARDYLGGVSVCDTRVKERACPPGM